MPTTEAPRFTSARMERILAIVIAVGAAIIGTQGILAAWPGLPHVTSTAVAVFFVVAAALVAMIAAALAGYLVRTAAGAFAVVYVLALLCWPFISDPARAVAARQPWIFFVLSVAVVAAILAFPFVVQLLFTVLLPFLYGTVRLAQGSFASEFWPGTAFDVSFALIFGLVLLFLAGMLRSVARGVDDARKKAVAGYTAAAAAEAAEEERIAIAALMHDSVLAALIAAERADSPRARELAVTMAREALNGLADAEDGVPLSVGDAPIDWDRLLYELRRVLTELGSDAEIDALGHTPPIPENVARAIVLAMRQACVNALAHAQGRGLRIVAEGVPAGEVRVTISDSGDGFDPQTVPDDRLGLRASVVARMAAVSGAAQIVSGTGGTEVTLRWPGPR